MRAGAPVREGLAEWVPIPGARNAHLCTFINKPSLVTSNAFVLRTPFEIVVIDPGASEEQKDRINQILTELVSRRPRPVLVLLTHCHHDHSCHAGSIEAAGGMVKRMAHIVAVEALHRRDPTLTVAELYPGAQICNARFDFCVFDPGALSLDRWIDFGTGVRLLMKRDAAETADGKSLARQAVQLGTGDELQFYHTPGHSPDHIAIRMGRHLWLGDLPFAANPGLAGLAGWDAAALVRSIENMIWLIDTCNIDICHTGHGRSLKAEAMREVLKRVHRECSSLGEIQRVDSHRVAMLRAHALDLLNVATDLFTVIAGRMLSTAHRLKLLEEAVYAERLAAAMDIDGIEVALAELRKFCESFRIDRLPELSVVLKCAQVMQRLEQALVAAGELAGAALTARATRLLGDFFNAVRGLQITSTVESMDANELANSVIQTLRARPALGDAAHIIGESEEAFSRALARRLAFVDILRNVRVELVPLDAPAMTMADSQRVADVLMDAVELIAASGSKRISLRTVCDGKFIQIEIHTPDASLRSAIDERRLGLYRRSLAVGGSALAAANDQVITVRLGEVR